MCAIRSLETFLARDAGKKTVQSFATLVDISRTKTRRQRTTLSECVLRVSNCHSGLSFLDSLLVLVMKMEPGAFPTSYVRRNPCGTRTRLAGVVLYSNTLNQDGSPYVLHTSLFSSLESADWRLRTWKFFEFLAAGHCAALPAPRPPPSSAPFVLAYDVIETWTREEGRNERLWAAPREF